MNGRELLAWNLRRLRVERGLSQDRLAGDTSVDRAYLGGLERKTENATVDLLDRLATGLSVEIAELFVVPEPGAEPPKALRAGRRKKD